MLVIFEDEHLIAVDKPPGISVIPERARPKEECLKAMMEKELGVPLYVVHRLDKDTSGVIVFAKTQEAHRGLCMGFEEREVKKVYVARVIGIPKEKRFQCNVPIGEGRKGKMRVFGRDAKPALTHFFWVQEKEQGDTSLLLASPVTGRRHQIRVHLAFLGLLVVGDNLYGGLAFRTSTEKPYDLLVPPEGKLLLRAWQLRLQHPITKSPLLLVADLPKWAKEAERYLDESF